MTQGLDRPGIKAEIERSGSSLTAIARAAKISPSSCRVALIYPVPAANRAIAEHLKKTVHDIWPDWFDEHGQVLPRVSSRIRNARRTSQKHGVN